MIGSGSAAIQMQKHPRHSYLSPAFVRRTSRPFSSRHLGHMASMGCSGGIWLSLPPFAVGRNSTFGLRDFLYPQRDSRGLNQRRGRCASPMARSTGQGCLKNPPNRTHGLRLKRRLFRPGSAVTLASVTVTASVEERSFSPPTSGACRSRPRLARPVWAHSGSSLEPGMKQN